MTLCRLLFTAALVVLATAPGPAQTTPVKSDIPPTFTASEADFDYTKRVAMVPMRDGVKLYTVIVIPKGRAHMPLCC